MINAAVKDLIEAVNLVYPKLLVARRGFELDDASGTVICRRCNKQRAAHCQDGSNRCSTATTNTFAPIDEEEREMVAAAVELCEKVRNF